MKMTKRAICLLLAAVMALALTIPVIAAEDTGGGTRTIVLDAGDQGHFPNGGTVYSVTATDNMLPELPAEAKPSRTGWTFNGWYTVPITYAIQYGNPAADDYWRWVPSTDAQPIRGNAIPDGVTKLYAGYTPTVITIKMYPCGWKGEYSPLITSRQYGTAFDSRVFGWNTKVNEKGTDDNSRYVIDDKWNNFTYLGWFSQVNGGNLIEDDKVIVGIGDLAAGNDGIVNVYMHWRNAAGVELQSKENPGYTPDKSAQYVSFADGEKKNIHLNDPYKLVVTTTPSKSDPTGIEWSVDHGDIVSVTPIKTADGKDTKEATIKGLQNGEANITVTLNGISDTIRVKVGHDFTIFIFGYSGDCDHKGSSQWKCSIEGCDARENRTTDFVHKYENPLTYPATCTSEGYTIRKCSVCKIEEKTNVTPAKGHQFEVTTEPGCGGENVNISKCSVCHYTEVTGGNGHEWEDGYLIDLDPTCISPGSKSIHCKNCPAVKDRQTIPATGEHKFPSDWDLIEKADPFQEGLEQRKCDDCGVIETHIIPKTPNYPIGGGGGGSSATPSPSPSVSPSPTPSQTPSPSPEPGTEPGVTPAPSPVPVPVDPPKTEDGSGWSYDYDTGDYYYFVDGEPKANYWANETSASQWGYWYYVGADGKLATGLQYIVNNNGTGWYFLQPDNTNGCVGKMLTGWQWLGPEVGAGWFSTVHGGKNGQCTYTDGWGDYHPEDNTWGDDHIAH